MVASSDNQDITVCVVHPDGPTRARLVTELGAERDVAVIDEAVSTAETIDRVLELVPDVLILPVDHPDIDSESIAARCHDDAPAVTIMGIVDDDTDEDTAYALLARGGGALVGADATLGPALRGAWRGESRLPAAVAARALSELDRITVDLGEAAHPPELTATEREVLERLGQGEDPTTIATEYEVTDRLVNLHAGYAVEKLHWLVDTERRLASMS